MASPQDVPDFDNFALTQKQASDNYKLRTPRSEGGDLDDEWYEQRMRRGAWGNPRRITPQEFMRRYPIMEDSEELDKEWGPVRLLGQGGFGLVGLWEKRDINNKTVDRVAIKHAEVLKDKGLYLGDSPPLLKEAVVHHDLNTKNADAFPWLRRYKYHRGQNLLSTRFRVPHAQRMYLEFCEHGDLDTLRSRYRLWDQHLPELFIWRVFHQLAMAGDALREQPPPKSLVLKHMIKERADAMVQYDEIARAQAERRRLNKTLSDSARLKEEEKLDRIMLLTEQDHYDPNTDTKQFDFQHYSTLHLDMKPKNVLLADPNWQGKKRSHHKQQQQQQQETQAAERSGGTTQSEDQESPENRAAKRPRTSETLADSEEPDRGDLDDPDYPLAKMSDFGLAQYTTYFHRANPHIFWRCGTESFKGPEQIGYGANWNIPPTGAVIREMRWGENGQVEANSEQEAHQLQRDDGQREIVFDHSLNIYGIGRTMYSLATLADDYELHGNRKRGFAERRAVNPHQYKACYHHQVRRVRTMLPKTYSPRLRHLIWRCIDPNPANRPSQYELRDRTERGLDMFVEKCRQEDDETVLDVSDQENNPNAKPPRPSQKLFYRGNEINNMPRGQAAFPLRWNDVREAFRDDFLNPDVPRLRIPPGKFDPLRPENPEQAAAFDKELAGKGPLWKKWESDNVTNNKWFKDGL